MNTPKKTKSPRGKTPSLIGGSSGRPRVATVQRQSACVRCNDAIKSGTICFEIPKLGRFPNYRRHCRECFDKILIKTQEDLAELRALLG
jgi:hypothetical protein